MNYYLCFDIGGTAIKYGIIDENANFLETYLTDTEATKGGQHIQEKILKLIDDIVRHYNICGVCISTAGMVNPESGEIIYASNTIPNYIGINFKKDIEELFQIPCEVENDVNCAGIAEVFSGVAKGEKSVFCLTVGTGIGGSFILDGNVYRGNTGSAKQGDPDCVEAIISMLDSLARGISNVCYVLNPKVVVLGGGFTGQGQWLEEEIRKNIKKYLLPIIFDNMEFKFALYKNDAGMIGAFYNFKNRQNL